MKLGELRGRFNMDCQWSNNGFRGNDELRESDYLRGDELSESVLVSIIMASKDPTN